MLFKDMKKEKITDWFGFFAPRFYIISAVIGVLVRIALMLSPLTTVDFTFVEWIKIFGLGLLNDTAFATLALIPAFAIYSFMTDAKYAKPWGWILEGLLLALTLYVFLFNDITDEYGGPLPRIVKAVLVFFLACFSLKFFIPALRSPWRSAISLGTILVYVCLAITNAVSENVFWSEFGVRYNFIAVDYLVYTNEVVGNIMESYPIIPMALAVIAVGALVTWLLVRGSGIARSGVAGLKRWAVSFCLMLACSGISIFWLHWGYRNAGSTNMYATQLQENGCWDFLEAFTSNELDYAQFYGMLPAGEAEKLLGELCGFDSTGRRHVSSELPLQRKNIVLITIESLSADFMARYGNSRGITPRLDSVAAQSLVFDRLFATGNRTVRGLEAVTLCIPPSSGESIVKRPDNGGLFSTGSVLRSLGYSTKYIYGGDSYFDNMGAFYGGNGYEVLDKKTYGSITFSNIWGTCDEDSYRKALETFDADYAGGQPFFAQIMTISNHRPYTYPEGKISYEGNPMSRSAAVKYTDWAIGAFLDEAAARPWFNETVFVIMADHCASSAGKTTLPLEGYHIPAMIYAPGFIEPQAVDKICSQIDVMPTLFHLLGFSYDSEFYGQNVLAPEFRQRAFMATYQDLGYYADDVLTVLSPVRQVRQFEVVPLRKGAGNSDRDGLMWEERPLGEENSAVLREAQACYQSANLKFSKKPAYFHDKFSLEPDIRNEAIHLAGADFAAGNTETLHQ